MERILLHDIRHSPQEKKMWLNVPLCTPIGQNQVLYNTVEKVEEKRIVKSYNGPLKWAIMGH